MEDHWDDGPDCSELHNIANLTDICGFVRNTSSCSVDQGLFNYTIFLYCTLGDLVIQVACLFLLIWWFFLFTGIGVTADNFFCPALAVISQSLKLSHNVAGVTFLAVGNGAPDIFASYAAISNAKEGDAGLAIGALFGAGMFITTVVAGSIAIARPFTSVQRPFLRDVIFFLGATFWAWFVMYDKKITQWEAGGFIILYVFYVLVVVLGHCINQRLKKRKVYQESVLYKVLGESLTASESDRAASDPLLGPPVEKATSENLVIVDKVIGEVRKSRRKNSNMWKALLEDINPIDVEAWRNGGIFRKFFECFKSPLVFCLKLTIPIVGEDNPDDLNDPRNWNRLLNSLQCFTGPVLAMFTTKIGFYTIGDTFPVYALVMIVSAILAVIVFATSKPDSRPVYHTAFAYLAFIVAVLWIYTIANEVVNILQAFGIVFDMSDAILGLTILAWGNSVADLVADLSLARGGYPRMGMSACFGGPFFNLLIGLGVPFTLACLEHDGVYYLKVNLLQILLGAGVGCSLLSTLIIVPLCGFKISRPYGIYLMVLYAIFIVIALLTETHVIDNPEL